MQHTGHYEILGVTVLAKVGFLQIAEATTFLENLVSSVSTMPSKAGQWFSFVPPLKILFQGSHTSHCFIHLYINIENHDYIYTWFFENRVSKNKDSFYYLGIKNNKIRPKADWKPISEAGH